MDAALQGLHDTMRLDRWWDHMAGGTTARKALQGLLMVIVPVCIVFKFVGSTPAFIIHLLFAKAWSMLWTSKALDTVMSPPKTTGRLYMLLMGLSVVYPLLAYFQGLGVKFVLAAVGWYFPVSSTLSVYLPWLWEAYSHGAAVLFACKVRSFTELKELRCFMIDHADYLLFFGIPPVLVSKLIYHVYPYAVVEMAVLDAMYCVQAWLTIEAAPVDSSLTSDLMMFFPGWDILVAKFIGKPKKKN